MLATQNSASQDLATTRAIAIARRVDLFVCETGVAGSL
jgi:hypothetical protein